MPRYLWGVDSAAPVTEDLYNCVVQNYGRPRYWGRYLKTIPNVSDGMTTEEINRIHQKGVRILPIYNDFSEAKGYQRGKIVARNSIFNAQRLGFPKDKIIFANVETFFEVDEAWIRGYTDEMFPSGYRPGIYADTNNPDFNEAYCTAVSKSERVSQQVVIWSESPTPGVTKEQNAPEFNPVIPPCIANVWGWQYGENAPACPIDTNLIDQRVFRLLW